MTMVINLFFVIILVFTCRFGGIFYLFYNCHGG
jgi:hypothetical protein